MPKLRIYVRDDLWERAQELAPGEGPSQLLQAALEDRVHRATSRPYAVVGDRLRKREEASAVAVSRQLETAYEIGYDTGLSFLEDLPWDALVAFAAMDFDLARMRERMAESEFIVQPPDGKEYVLDWDAFWAQEGPADLGDAPEGVVLEGFVDACRSVWEKVGGPATRPVSPSPDPASPGATAAGQHPDSVDEGGPAPVLPFPSSESRDG